MNWKISLFTGCIISLIPLVLNAADPTSIQVDNEHIRKWNKFTDDLLSLHKAQISRYPVSIEESIGGYSSNPDFYTEKLYRNKNTGMILSRIQREINKPANIHLIEVYVYDSNGTLQRDYLSVYLPDFRNAPIQTLINFHFHDHELSSFRQFDASGNRIYEQCSGTYFGNPVFISLEEHEIPFNSGQPPEEVSNELYLACFNQLPSQVGKYINPANEITLTAPDRQIGLKTYENLEKQINLYTDKIANNPNSPDNYIERAKLYFDLHEFQQSIDDLSTAIQLDNNQDEAYFWRGMSLARNGQIDEGIADLSVFLQRNPTSSRGYTKRGVRYIWKGDFKQAERDLSRAIQLDKNNAEAHDDLGVIYAQRGELKKAIKHFSTTVKIDPSYQKAWHNLATAEFLSLNYDSALRHVNQALRLTPGSKNSLLLKGEILMAQGKKDKARQVIDEAEFLPDGNWSEQLPLK